MKLEPVDLDRYRSATRDLRLPSLDEEQCRALDERARRYRGWLRGHVRLHNAVSLILVVGLVGLDLLVAAWAGRQSSVLVAVALMTFVHGYLTYSLTIYTMHEGAGHNLLFLGRSAGARRTDRLLAGTCRLFFADPAYYASVHPSHHANLATEGDGAYTHYVAPERFARSLLPLAGLLPFNDYLIHTDHSFSRSHIRSMVLGVGYHAALLFLIMPATGLWLGVLTLVVFAAWFAFTLDRVRETYDHLFTPDHRRWGARSLGVGGLGMLFGGGPWGQPCHLSHHFSPGLPWYLQLKLHRDFGRVLRPDQREAFLTPRLSSFVRTYARNVKLMREGKKLIPARGAAAG